MSTDIMQGTNHTITISTHDDRIFADLEQKVVAFIGNLANVAGINPALVNNLFQFPLIGHMRAIKVGIYGKAWLF